VPGEIGPTGKRVLPGTGSEVGGVRNLLWNSRQEWTDAGPTEGKTGGGGGGPPRRIEKADDAEYWLTWELNRLVREKASGRKPIQIHLAVVEHRIHREELARSDLRAGRGDGSGGRRLGGGGQPDRRPDGQNRGLYTGIVEGLRKVHDSDDSNRHRSRPPPAPPPDSTTGTASKKETSATSPSEAGTPAKNAP
jgi:hypothetical protein